MTTPKQIQTAIANVLATESPLSLRELAARTDYSEYAIRRQGLLPLLNRRRVSETPDWKYKPTIQP